MCIKWTSVHLITSISDEGDTMGCIPVKEHCELCAPRTLGCGDRSYTWTHTHTNTWTHTHTLTCKWWQRGVRSRQTWRLATSYQTLSVACSAAGKTHTKPLGTGQRKDLTQISRFTPEKSQLKCIFQFSWFLWFKESFLYHHNLYSPRVNNTLAGSVYSTE